MDEKTLCLCIQNNCMRKNGFNLINYTETTELCLDIYKKIDITSSVTHRMHQQLNEIYKNLFQH